MARSLCFVALLVLVAVQGSMAGQPGRTLQQRRREEPMQRPTASAAAPRRDAGNRAPEFRPATNERPSMGTPSMGTPSMGMPSMGTPSMQAPQRPAGGVKPGNAPAGTNVPAIITPAEANKPPAKTSDGKPATDVKDTNKGPADTKGPAGTTNKGPDGNAKGPDGNAKPENKATDTKQDASKPGDKAPDTKPDTKDASKPSGTTKPGDKAAPGAGTRPVSKGDKSGLNSLTKGTQGLKSKPKTPIAPPTSGKAQDAFIALTRPSPGFGRPTNSLRLLAEAFAVSSAFAVGALASAMVINNNAPYIGSNMYWIVNDYPSQAPVVFADTAVQMVNNGQTSSFADTIAYAFAEAKRNNNIPAFTRAVADAINRGGPPAQFAFSEAIARAYSQGGDAQAGVVEATAYALCSGGSTADAWGYAMAIALENYPDACGAVTQANVLSAAQCASTLSFGGNAGYVMGFCGL